MSKELRDAIHSLLNDIDSMGEAVDPNFFGPFSEYVTHHNTIHGGVSVEWPNLTISANKVKELLRRG